MPVSIEFADYMGWDHEVVMGICEISVAISKRGKSFALDAWDRFVTSDRSPFFVRLDDYRQRLASARDINALCMPFIVVGVLNFAKSDFKLHKP